MKKDMADKFDKLQKQVAEQKAEQAEKADLKAELAALKAEQKAEMAALKQYFTECLNRIPKMNSMLLFHYRKNQNMVTV